MPGSDIRQVTPTICRLYGIEPPALSTGDPIPDVAGAAYTVLGRSRVDRMLVFAPDALGRLFLEVRPKLLDRIRRAAPLSCELDSVLPTKTPVCFASMFTGAEPGEHGITRYEKKLFTKDTVFDALARAGFRVAIVAVKNSSIDVMYRGRGIDYFSEGYDPDVIARTLELIEQARHDFILGYVQEYDDAVHASTHDSPKAVAAAERHVEQFELLAAAADEHWAQYNRALAFVSDHGAHTVDGKGTHGDDIPEDVGLLHFWRIGAGIPTGATALRAWDGAAEAWDDFVQSGKDWYRTEVHGPARALTW